jgi:hypothetical protein
MHAKQRDMLLQFLKDTEPTCRWVDSWPEWKRRPLGPIPTQPYFPPISNEELRRRSKECCTP